MQELQDLVSRARSEWDNGNHQTSLNLLANATAVAQEHNPEMVADLAQLSLEMEVEQYEEFRNGGGLFN